jgi:hypothetical protein
MDYRNDRVLTFREAGLRFGELFHGGSRTDPLRQTKIVAHAKLIAKRTDAPAA